MFKIFQKNNFFIKLFILVSLFNLILLIFFFCYFKNYLINYYFLEEQNARSVIFMDDIKIDSSDPYITKVFDLKSLINKPVINNLDPKIGDNNAKIIIVEFSDFKCKYCGEQEKMIKNIIKEYKNDIKLIWKDFPESNKNSESWKSAVAARCAGEQGKFWEYHDLLFENIENLNSELYINLAKTLEIKINIFEECLMNEKVHKMIISNIAEANFLGINGIPFLYMNDQEIFGEINEKDFRKIIEIELNR